MCRRSAPVAIVRGGRGEETTMADTKRDKPNESDDGQRETTAWVAPTPRKGTESHLTSRCKTSSHASFGPRRGHRALQKGAHMPTRSLPPRPDLAQLKRQANELRQLHREGKQSAAARIIANHPRLKRASPATVLGAKLALADAQLVIAREYGFESWAALKHEVEAGKRVAKFKPHPAFNE